MTGACEEGLVQLSDGRQLAYADWGDPAGAPVVLMHGWPGSRLGGALLDGTAGANGARLIVPDRPGLGRSDPCQGRTLSDWPDDLDRLMTTLGVERFALVGYSGGAAYALACAHRLRDRVSAVAIVSGLAPVPSVRATMVLPPHMIAILSLCRVYPALAGVPVGALSFVIHSLPRLLALQTRLAVCADDRRVLSRPAVFEALQAEYREAFRQGTGAVAHEAVINARDWGFPLRQLPPGIHLYHGRDDRLIPAALAYRLARALPACRCRIVPGAGHFWIADHFGEVLADIGRHRGTA